MPDDGYGYLWRSGQLVRSQDATVHVRSVGHASVSAVFEGVNGYWSEEFQQLHVFRLRDHLMRLADSTRLAHLTATHTVDDLVTATVELLQRNEVRRDVHIRPWNFVAGNPIEQMVPEDAECETVIDSWPFGSGLDQHRVRTAAVTSWGRVSRNTSPPRIKAFANYHNGRLGNIDARHRGADWPIMLNERGQVAESSGAAIGLFTDGVFRTPGPGSGVLPSITVRTVLELLRTDLGIPAVECDLNRDDLYLADEVVFVGTSAEVLPIVRVDDFQIGDGDIGPLTARLRAEYLAVLRGARPKRADWLTPVWPDQR